MASFLVCRLLHMVSLLLREIISRRSVSRNESTSEPVQISIATRTTSHNQRPECCWTDLPPVPSLAFSGILFKGNAKAFSFSRITSQSHSSTNSAAFYCSVDATHVEHCCRVAKARSSCEHPWISPILRR